VERASLPSRVLSWIALRRDSASGRSVPSLTMIEPTALPPSAEASWDCLAFRPTGTIETRDELGSASCSIR